GATSSATVTNATGGNASGTFVMPAGALAENGGSIIVMGNAITSGNDSVGAEAFGSASTVTVHGNVEGVARGAHANGTGSQVNVTGNATATGAAGDGARANLGGEVNVDGNAISTNDGFGAVANGGGSFVTVEGNASATGGFGIGAAAFANGQVVVRSNVSGELNGSFADNGTVIVEGNVTVTSAGGPGAEVLAGGNIRIDGTITAPIFARVAGANRAQNSFNTPTTLAGYLTYDNRPTTPVTSVWVRDPATPTPPIITNALAPNGTVGTAYNFIFTASGNPTPTWTHSGTLPAGLALSAMGVLSGTPTTVGTFTFTVQASNGVIPNAIEPVTVVVSSPHIPVTSITSVPTTTTAGTALALSGTVAPTIATNNAITWSIVNAGGTGASITGGNTLNTTAAGTVTVRATISDGMLAGVNYTQHFNITVNAGSRTTSSFNTTGATDLPDSTIFAPISVSNATPEGRLEYQVIAAGRHAVLVVTVPANPPGGWPLEGVVTINGHPITVDSTTSWSTFRTDFASALSAANIEMQTGTGGQFLVSAAAGSGQSIILDGNDAILLGALGVGAAPAARANHGSDAEIDITGMFDAANNRIIAADAWTAAAHGNQVTITGAGGVEIRFNLMVRHNPGTPAGSGAAIPPGHTFAGGEPAPVRNPAGALIGSPVDMALHIGPAPAPNLVSITLQGGGTGASISHNQAAANTIITVNAGTRAGYNFNGWTSSPTVTFANANNTSTTFTMPSSAVTVTANWTPQVAYTPNDTGDSDPGPNYGWLSPSSVNFDLANPRNITITFNRGDFTFRNNIRFGNVNLIQGRDFSVEGVRITIWEDFLQTLEVGQRILTIEMSGGANPQLTVNVTDSRPMTATTVLTPAPLLRFDVGSNIFIHNGITLQSDAAPFIDPAYNRVMVPLRLIAEALGAEVEWDEEARRVDIWRIAFVSLTIGEPLPGGMGVPAIVNDRTFVPLRYVAEILGADVYWDSAARAIYIY
ncbi:MAG: stalk domain-containing protein, partial [Defluviitaleaceae bacterium]|nr:stalk domain-containing protein [Defluviitaleaceae bacterium]